MNTIDCTAAVSREGKSVSTIDSAAAVWDVS